MQPGQGAEEQAGRRARRREQIERELAAGRATAEEVTDRLARLERQQRNWAAGAEGERTVARALEPLAAYGWLALHDLRWPGRPLANLDHVAVGPGGVVIIDAKSWSGQVDVREGELRQNGYRRSTEVEGVASAANAVAAMLAPQHRTAVRGVLCLAHSDQAPTTTALGVPVVGSLALARMLVDLPLRLTPYDVADISRFLTRELTTPPRTERTQRTSRARSTRRPRQRPAPTIRNRKPARRRSIGRELFGVVLRVGAAAVGLMLFLAVLQNGLASLAGS